MKKYAVFHLHFYISISTLSRQLHMDKISKILCINDLSDISKYSDIPLQKIFSENFCPECDSLACADMDM